MVFGGSTVDQATGSGTASYTPAGLTSASITAVDTVTSEKVTISGNSSGITGTVSFGGSTIATFSTDLNGNGSISYSNGTTGTISGWAVQS